MKKEVKVRAHTRKTKSGKTVVVRAHTAKHEAATMKKGSGRELENKLRNEEPFTLDDYKAWYHWDQESDPDNETALKVEKALIKQMGKRKYNKYFDELTENYSPRGHTSAYKKLGFADTTKKEVPKVKSKRTDDELMTEIMGMNDRGGSSKVFGVGMAKLRDKRGNVIGTTVDTPNAIAHAMANHKDIYSADGILGPVTRSDYEDRFSYTKSDKNLGRNLRMKEKSSTASRDNVTIETHYRGRLKKISTPTVMRQPSGTSDYGEKYPERYLAFDTTSGNVYVAKSEKEATSYLRNIGISKKDITYLGIK